MVILFVMFAGAGVSGSSCFETTALRYPFIHASSSLVLLPMRSRKVFNLDGANMVVCFTRFNNDAVPYWFKIIFFATNVFLPLKLFVKTNHFTDDHQRGRNE